MPKGRPIKAITETMALVEDTEAAMMFLGRYSQWNYEQHGRSLDKRAMQTADETLAKWRELRSKAFQQGLLYNGGDSKDMKGEDPSEQARAT